jgi:excisionase family DNA binding protein
MADAEKPEEQSQQTGEGVKEEELLTLTEAARYLNISQPTMTKRVADGELTPVYKGARRRPVYFRKSDLDEYLRNYQAMLEEERQAKLQKIKNKGNRTDGQ